MSDVVKDLVKGADDLISTREEEDASRDLRHKTDSNSDSWFAKFVRPFALIYLLLLLTAVEVFTISVSESFHSTIKGWGDLAFMWYFGSRGLEKIAQITNRQIRFLKRDERKKERRGSK